MFRLLFSSLLASGGCFPSFLTSDSDSACRNPPRAHLQTPGNLQKLTKITLFFMSFIFLWFGAVILVPELFRKLRETPGMHSHQVSSKSEIGCTSYDQRRCRILRKTLENLRKTPAILAQTIRPNQRKSANTRDAVSC